MEIRPIASAIAEWVVRAIAAALGHAAADTLWRRPPCPLVAGPPAGCVERDLVLSLIADARASCPVGCCRGGQPLAAVGPRAPGHSELHPRALPGRGDRGLRYLVAASGLPRLLEQGPRSPTHCHRQACAFPPTVVEGQGRPEGNRGLEPWLLLHPEKSPWSTTSTTFPTTSASSWLGSPTLNTWWPPPTSTSSSSSSTSPTPT